MNEPTYTQTKLQEAVNAAQGLEEQLQIIEMAVSEIRDAMEENDAYTVPSLLSKIRGAAQYGKTKVDEFINAEIAMKDEKAKAVKS